MTPVQIKIHSRQPDGEILYYQTMGSLQRRSNRLSLFFPLQVDHTLPPTECRLIYWRKGLAILETKGSPGYCFRLDEGARTQTTLTVDSLTTPVTIQTESVRQKGALSHGTLHLHYRLYTGQALLNENDVTLDWETK